MAGYLLPCACGRRQTVTVSQAGQSVLCHCGAQLEVPTLRGLRALATSEDSGARPTAAATWDNRHRALFVLLLVLIASLSAAAVLFARLPEAQPDESTVDFGAIFATQTPAQVFEMFQELRSEPLTPARGDRENAGAQRWFMLAEIAVAVGLAAASALAALVILARPSKPRR
jgi:hypothetical protein